MPAPPARPIVILGFGRSGTTWLADIVSKVLGPLILFEPLHPSVSELSHRLSYRVALEEEDSRLLRQHLEQVLAGRCRRPWLLRNHVPFPLSEMSETWLDTIWNECAIGGIKMIRGCSWTAWLHRELEARVVHVVRHPAAVVASIVRRKNFWEFGWPGTWELFVERTRERLVEPAQARLVETAASDIERTALMWAITVAHQLEDAARTGAPIVFYERLYLDPFGEARRLFTALGEGDVAIHPAHLFTPAMTTLKTVHGLRAFEPWRGPAEFWEGTLTDGDVARIERIAATFGLEPAAWSRRVPSP